MASAFKLSKTIGLTGSGASRRRELYYALLMYMYIPDCGHLEIIVAFKKFHICTVVSGTQTHRSGYIHTYIHT